MARWTWKSSLKYSTPFPNLGATLSSALELFDCSYPLDAHNKRLALDTYVLDGISLFYVYILCCSSRFFLVFNVIALTMLSCSVLCQVRVFEAIPLPPTHRLSPPTVVHLSPSDMLETQVPSLLVSFSFGFTHFAPLTFLICRTMPF